MSYEVLTTQDTEAWHTYLAQLPLRFHDPHFMPEYYAMWETGTIRAECFVYEVGHVYPYLRAGEKIFGCYGYNGVGTPPGTGLDGFSDTFRQYCRDTKVKEEFTRINPVLPTSGPNYMKPEYNRDVIVVDLLRNPWDGYHKSCRKAIRKAHREGVRVQAVRGRDMTTEWMSVFTDIYGVTMSRVDADGWYRFDREWFWRLTLSLPDNTVYFFAMYKDECVSCELVLHGRLTGYSFLGGTREDAFPVRPNNLLKHEAIKWLRSKGMTDYLLGGGKEPGDGLERYKETFAVDGRRPFYVGRYEHG